MPSLFFFLILKTIAGLENNSAFPLVIWTELCDSANVGRKQVRCAFEAAGASNPSRALQGRHSNFKRVGDYIIFFLLISIFIFIYLFKDVFGTPFFYTGICSTSPALSLLRKIQRVRKTGTWYYLKGFRILVWTRNCEIYVCELFGYEFLLKDGYKWKNFNNCTASTENSIWLYCFVVKLRSLGCWNFNAA